MVLMTWKSNLITSYLKSFVAPTAWNTRSLRFLSGYHCRHTISYPPLAHFPCLLHLLKRNYVNTCETCQGRLCSRLLQHGRETELNSKCSKGRWGFVANKENEGVLKINYRMALFQDDKQDYSMEDYHARFRDYCNRGERLGSVLNTTMKSRNFSWVADWGTVGGKLLWRNVSSKGGFWLNLPKRILAERWADMIKPHLGNGRGWENWVAIESDQIWRMGVCLNWLRFLAKLDHVEMNMQFQNQGLVEKTFTGYSLQFGQGENLC